MSIRFGILARAARAIVGSTVWDSEAEDAVANLDEIYEARRRAHGSIAAGLWYLGQALTFGPRLWLDRRGRPAVKDTRDRSRVATWLDGARADARFAVRGFRKTPGFTGAVVATLGLAVAANALIFAVVRGVVLRPPPFPEPERLAWVWPGGELALTHRTFSDVSRLTRAAELTAFASRAYAIQGIDRPDEVTGLAVSTNHFRVLGRPPVVGRAFRAEDGQPGREAVALISFDAWQTRFGGDPSVIGRRIELFTSAAIPMLPGAFTGTPHSVVGVLPPDYRPLGYAVDVVTPLVEDPADDAFTQLGELLFLGRLAPGASFEQLRAELVSVADRIPQLEPSMEAIGSARVVAFQDAVTGPVRPALFVTLAAVGLVLLIACANVASLMLARAQGRRNELGLRAALGASRGRLARQLLTECSILAAGAGALGLLIAGLLLPRLVPVLPPALGASSEAIALDSGVLLFVIGALLLTLVTTGLIPAHGVTGGLPGSLGGRRRGTGGTRRTNRALQTIVVSELALAVMLATGAGLLLKSFVRLTDVDAGFSPRDVVTARIAPSDLRYADAELRRALVRDVLDRVRALPRVEAAGAIHFLPIADGGPGINFTTNPADPENRQSTGYRVVTPGYFDAMGIPLLAGRPLRDTDHQGAELVGLVNRALAERLWPDEDPVGKRLYRTSGQAWFTVVGVMGDVRQSAVGLPPSPEAYLPLAQSEWASAMTVVVRSPEPAVDMGRAVEDIIWSVDPQIPITRSAAMDDLVHASIASPRFYGFLFSAFAVVALVLGAIGVYGVLAFVVRQRVDEIGVRIALGATRRRIVSRELARAGRLVALGLGIGLAATLLASRTLSSLLYEVSALDPIVFAGAGGVLAVVALVSALAPARRAAGVDPLVSIRGH
ncbi:MAG: ABC transporter permease [Gemmatimonadetes bacterium]|nr:ABC transporter permease [Gemmatimonadota bacterium]